VFQTGLQLGPIPSSVGRETAVLNRSRFDQEDLE